MSSLGSRVIIVQVRSQSLIRDLSSFPEPGKGERASVFPVFHGDREWQLRLSRFAPFVKSIRRHQLFRFRIKARVSTF